MIGTDGERERESGRGVIHYNASIKTDLFFSFFFIQTTIC